MKQNKDKLNKLKQKKWMTNCLSSISDSDDESEMRSGDSSESKIFLKIACNNKIKLFLMHGFSI